MIESTILIVKDNFITKFRTDEPEYSDDTPCNICNDVTMSGEYIEIIDRLKEKNLIDKNYIPRCCFCDFLLNFDDEVLNKIKDADLNYDCLDLKINKDRHVDIWFYYSTTESEVRFRGNIKNKSELVKILKMLDIE